MGTAYPTTTSSRSAGKPPVNLQVGFYNISWTACGRGPRARLGPRCCVTSTGDKAFRSVAKTSSELQAKSRGLEKLLDDWAGTSSKAATKAEQSTTAAAAATRATLAAATERSVATLGQSCSGGMASREQQLLRTGKMGPRTRPTLAASPPATCASLTSAASIAESDETEEKSRSPLPGRPTAGMTRGTIIGKVGQPGGTGKNTRAGAIDGGHHSARRPVHQ